MSWGWEPGGGGTGRVQMPQEAWKGRPCRWWPTEELLRGLGEELDRFCKGHKVHEGQAVLLKHPSRSGQEHWLC